MLTEESMGALDGAEEVARDLSVQSLAKFDFDVKGWLTRVWGGVC